MICPLPIQTLEYHAVISSTNDRMKELFKHPVVPPLPCLVIAKQQTAGRGRENKAWWSGEGAVLMSVGFGLSPATVSRNELPLLSVTAAQAVMTVLKRYLPENKIELHLPNDVYVEEKKICGILLESPSPSFGILGIGLNVNNRLRDIPPEFQAEFEKRPFTSMIEMLGRELPLPRLCEEILTELAVPLHCITY
ncbi:MAG: biotin--[acetyl-CoA-carboxylase] ligase [Planctomycetaceae bacterium]|jgi:BirA family biotin operon repressor/biotin-[acetyl-CoA-carboxylase] ligase|nr:biotin--[acetyl-CoA-carboxylase] ligase [Planctomycetaceae bacterium]